jgi:ribonucleoside-diphosphate reductase alpha chain
MPARAQANGTHGAALEARLELTHEEGETALLTETRPATEPDQRTLARLKGYEGDSCGECGNFTLVRNGTCLKCDSCGGTSGCRWHDGVRLALYMPAWLGHHRLLSG